MRHAAVLALLMCAQAASASGPPPASSGHQAVALGVLVGLRSPALSAAKKANLDEIINDKAPSSGSKITIDAKSVVCRAGDVDIAAFSCALTFGTHTVTLSGRAANEIFATLIENGVQSDAAAGTVFEALHTLSCILDPATIAGKNGGGANCSFVQGQ